MQVVVVYAFTRYGFGRVLNKSCKMVGHVSPNCTKEFSLEIGIFYSRTLPFNI